MDDSVVVAGLVLLTVLLCYCMCQSSKSKDGFHRRHWRGWGGRGWGGWGYPTYYQSIGYDPWASSVYEVPQTIVVKDKDPSKLSKEEWEYLYTSGKLKESPNADLKKKVE